MKKIFETPELLVVALGCKDVIATSGPTTGGIGTGADITPGQNVPCDAPGRQNIWK